MKRFAMVAVTMLALVSTVGCKKKDTTTSAGSAAMTGSGSAAVDPGSAAKPVDEPGSAAPGSAAMDPGSAAPGSAAAPTAARPASITDEMIASADKMVAAVDGLATDLKAAGTDCKKATAAMKTRFDEIAKAATEIEKMKSATDKDPAAKDWMKVTYMSKMEGSINTMMASAMACKDDKDFVDTMKKFPLSKKKDNKGAPDAKTDAKADPAMEPKKGP